MLSGLAVFFVVSAVVIAAHKLGHYLVGRWLAGIPASDIKFVVVSLPQYVALRNGDRWASPTAFDSYLSAYAEHDPELSHIVAFLAAGELTQTAAVVGFAGLAVITGLPIVAQSAILGSLLLTGYHLFSDFGLNLHMGHPTGDFSGLWTYSPVTAASVGLLFVVPHGILYAVFI